MTFDLTGNLLISTPAMADPRFSRSVVLLCAHGADGAFGLVLNRPLPRLTLAKVFDQIGIEPVEARGAGIVLSGGPVETQRGFVLHTGPEISADGQRLPGGLTLSASLDVLRAVARGEGPDQWLLALGYAGWGAGQLEAEIAQNAWLHGPATTDLIFDPKPGEHQWNDALRLMGIDPVSLSAVAGRA